MRADKLRSWLAVACVILGSCSACNGAPDREPGRLADQAAGPIELRVGETLAIENGTVIPMDRDTALAFHTLVIRDGRIAWLGPADSANVPRNAKRIDARGLFVLPGLADMHVHIESRADLSEFVASGVTTVRNMRGGPQHVAWRDSVRRGKLVGPTIITTGPTCCHGRTERREFIRLRTPLEVEEAVRQQREMGYDMVKVHSRLAADVFGHLAAKAREAGMPIVGHVLAEVGLEAQLSAGQASLEHYDGLFSRAGRASGAAAIARAGAEVGTILSARDGSCRPPSSGDAQIIMALRLAGVSLLAGSDASLGGLRAGTALHCELETLAAAGLSNYEALAAATVNAQAFMREHLPSHEPFGTLSVGSRGDVMILSADPRLHLAALRTPVGVVAGGRWLHSFNPAPLETISSLR